MADLDSTFRPHLESQLEDGEELRGICVASQQKGFIKGGAVALGITDRRLLVQQLNRRGDPDGVPRPITPRSAPRGRAEARRAGTLVVSLSQRPDT